MSDRLRQARLAVANEVLVSAMHMPHGTRIVNAYTDWDDVVHFVVEHEDLPESEHPIEVTPTVTHRREEFLWNWNVEGAS